MNGSPDIYPICLYLLPDISCFYYRVFRINQLSEFLYLHPHFKTVRKVYVHHWTQCVNWSTFKLLKEFYICNQYMRFEGVICFRIYILFHSKRKINLANTIMKCYNIYTCNTIYFRYICFLCQEKNTRTEKNRSPVQRIASVYGVFVL